MRFVILHHTGWPGRADHYDLMLQLEEGREEDPVLKTFSTLSDVFPTGDPPYIELKLLQNHRLAYLSLEGALSNNRGYVTRVDAGEFKLAQTHSTARDMQFELSGKILRGIFRLNWQRDDRYIFQKC